MDSLGAYGSSSSEDSEPEIEAPVEPEVTHLPPRDDTPEDHPAEEQGERRLSNPSDVDKQRRLRRLLASYPPLPVIDTETTQQEVDPVQTQKIQRLLELRKQGLKFNDTLTRTHAFRNPSIMAKMIAFLGLDQYGTNDERLVESWAGFPEGAYYDAVSATQQKGLFQTQIPSTTLSFGDNDAPKEPLPQPPPRTSIQFVPRSQAKASTQKSSKREKWWRCLLSFQAITLYVRSHFRVITVKKSSRTEIRHPTWPLFLSRFNFCIIPWGNWGRRGDGDGQSPAGTEGEADSRQTDSKQDKKAHSPFANYKTNRTVWQTSRRQCTPL